MSKTNKDLKYSCRKCQTVRAQFFGIVWDTPGDDSTKREIEITKEWEVSAYDTETKTERKSIFKGRKLTCGHWIDYRLPGFVDISDTLSDVEIQIIREKIAKEMIGLQAKELEAKILFHVEQYQTFLKISQKQTKQAKFAILFLDELREKYVKQLSEQDKQTFEMKFAHFLDQRPTTVKTIERERTKTDKDADKQKQALEAAKQVLAKSGLDKDELKKLFMKRETPNSGSETNETQQ